MPNGLFKYFGTAEDKLDKFTNRQVYLTPPKWFNDPWDFLLRSEPPTAADLGFLDPKDVPGFLRGVSTGDSLEEEALAQQEGLSKIIGLVCLSEEPLNRLMWAHYGECHRGFVAEFKCSVEAETNAGYKVCESPFAAAVKVRYQDTQPLLKRDTANMEDVVLTKHIDWLYEREWRVIRELSTGLAHPTHQGFVLVEFKPDDLLRVILGLRSPRELRSRLGQMLNQTGFEHVRGEEVSIDPVSRELRCRPFHSQKPP